MRHYRTLPAWMGPLPHPPGVAHPPGVDGTEATVIDPVSGVHEHEVHEILRFRLHYGKPHPISQLVGKDALGGVAAFEAARGIGF